MAVYKVIQDIEADDKLVGPFGIKQFIYLLIVAFLSFVAYRVSEVAILLALPFLPFIIFFALLALPFGGAQPTDVWLLAKFRFFLKTHKHVWSQDGVKNLVTITVPKELEKHLTKELSQSEVRSRLEALAETIDSRGWAIKNVDANLFAQPAFAAIGVSDRLINSGGAIAGQPPVTTDDVAASDDMLDTQNNPAAQKLSNLIQSASKSRRQQLTQQIKQNAAKAALTPPPASLPATPPAPAPPSQPVPPVPATGSVVQPQPSAVQGQNQPAAPPKQTGPLSEEELLEKIHAEQNKPKNYGHLHVVQPLDEQAKNGQPSAPSPAPPPPPPPPPPPVTRPPDPDIIELAGNNDLNVETIARQVNKKKANQPPPGEVVIKLH